MDIAKKPSNSGGDEDVVLSTSAPVQSSLLSKGLPHQQQQQQNNKTKGGGGGGGGEKKEGAPPHSGGMRRRNRSKSTKQRSRSRSVKKSGNNVDVGFVKMRKDNPGETTEVFDLTVAIKRSPGMEAALKFFRIGADDLGEIYREERMMMSRFCNRETIAKLWAQKDLLDDLFDANDGQVYYSLRDKLYPEDKTHGNGNGSANRTGRKFEQILEAIPVLDDLDDIFFLDVCGAPGSFSQVLLHRDTQSPFKGKGRGWGVSLLQKGGGSHDNWHQSLVRASNFSIIKDGGGNVFKQNVVSAIHRLLTQDGGKRENRKKGEEKKEGEKKEEEKKEGEKEGEEEEKKEEKRFINVVVADGGFKIHNALVSGQTIHMENVQELCSGRILLSEVLVALKVLQKGGRFVCKLFDSLSDLTVSIMYVCCLCFDKVQVVKPSRSRVVNSEKYLVCLGRCEDDAVFSRVVSLLERFHGMCTQNLSPLAVVPVSLMMGDGEFVKKVTAMNQTIAEKQTKALEVIYEMVDEHLRKKDPAKRGGDIANSLAKLSLEMTITNTPPSPGLKKHQQQQVEPKKGEENEDKNKQVEEKKEEEKKEDAPEEKEQDKKDGEVEEAKSEEGDLTQQPFGKSKRKVVFLLPGGSNLKVAPTTPIKSQENQGEAGEVEDWEETYKELEGLRLTTKQEKLMGFNELLGEREKKEGGGAGGEGKQQAPRTPLMAVPLSEVGFTPVWGPEQADQLQFPPSMDMDFSFLEEDPILKELGKQMK